jgi:Putative Actinobacterial Holin-X, holin superfamily III
MAQEQLKHSVLPSALADVVADVADLFQKELRLARTEFSAKLSTKFRAGIWISVAAAFAVIAGLLIVQALVFGIAAFGIAMHWSCLIVAAAMAAAAALAYAKGRADLREELTPSRAIHQVKQDIATAKEHLT